MSRERKGKRGRRTGYFLLYAFKVEDAEVGAAEDDPVLVVFCLGDGGALEGERVEFPALCEGVAEEGEGLLLKVRVCEDEGAEVGERGGDRGRDGPDGVVGEEEVGETAEEGEVGEGGDVVVCEVERV